MNTDGPWVCVRCGSRSALLDGFHGPYFHETHGGPFCRTCMDIVAEYPVRAHAKRTRHF